MSFSKVDPQADFPALEREVLQFWADRGIFQKRRDMNAGKPTWSFLDGPITANNPMGVHHAWGRTYKDVFNRYFAMTGHELRYQNGFDCQGLWVEVEVEKELGLKSKRDIENLVPGDREASVAKFVQLCKDRVDKFARVQTEQSVRLGMWMDWDRTDADWAKPVDERKSYFTMSNENNYTIWSFLKKCHGKGLIYRGYDAMPWCGRCGVGISEQEMKEGYKLIEHRAAFVKFPLRGRPNENLLVWTTTPWTLTSNVGAAVNPELVYLKVQLKGETYYVSKGAFKLDRMAGGDGEDDEGSREAQTSAKKSKKAWLDGVPHLKSIEQMFKEKAGKDGFTIAGEVKGEELLGWEYDGPFDDLPAQQAESGYPEGVARVVRARGWAPPKPAMACHRVVSGGKDVTDTEGTGIVHTAPGCGAIDFTWGKENGLPPVAPLDEAGNFLDGFGPLAGKNAADPATAEAVFEQLKAKNLLFTTERYVHRYPHCWRCKTELLYRLVDEWFIGMGKRNTEEGFRGDVMKVVKQVTFLPESLNGRAREYDWLWNMGDWMISKKRFWGLALPIWVDEQTGDFEVIGSYAELKERAVEGWQDFDGNSPHRPFVDKVKIKNPKTGNLMSRIPDVGNPWLDAGIVAFSTMGYNRDRDYWRKWYPADFITESFPGQFRNWFYALLALSTMMSDGEPPFKTLLGFATVTDQFGKPMHKSDGNAIEFNSAAGDDNNRYELFTDIPYQGDETKAVREKNEGKALGSLPDGWGLSRTATVEINGVKKTRVFGLYPPMGADVIRWMYCRANPALNVKFGPEPADEVRSKFIFKLWNSYSFFCNCAAGDGFEPSNPAHSVPFKERPELDQWVLSCLHDLVWTATLTLAQYNVGSFALRAEHFVEEELSNWYVRRVKPRLNSKVADLDAAGLKDKWAAYQTLHTVLTTLCRLLAPCIPFITEVMWQNLGGGAESVHLTHYPKPDEVPLSYGILKEMDTLRDVITLGGAARNVAKISVRQPLAELAVRVVSDAEVATVKRFDQLIRDELNVKAVTVHPPTVAPLLSASAKFNAKTANAKLGAKRKDAEAELAKFDARELAKQLRAGPVEFAGVPLEATDVLIEYAAAQTGYAGTADNRGREGVVSTAITEELKREGLARNVVRQVNIARKDANLDIADSIVLHLSTTAEPLAKAIAAHRDTIAGESQATAWSDTPPDGGHRSEAKIDGHPLVIAFRKG